MVVLMFAVNVELTGAGIVDAHTTYVAASLVERLGITENILNTKAKTTRSAKR